MLFLVDARFKPGVEARRAEIHEQYNAHLAQHRPRVRLAGSIRDDAGGRLGVLMLIEAEDREEVDRFVARSPYTEAGLYAGIAVAPLDVQVGSLG